MVMKKFCMKVCVNFFLIPSVIVLNLLVELYVSEYDVIVKANKKIGNEMF